ncbi:hypothetical protein [Thermococcus sp. JCM 11816]|uniref:hypothetical protein n=1 Tax=Thermococcus sp. (strain JCM 11816 / KS-1) TaxID=1295125 RepID=UPI000AD091A5
MAVFEVLDIYEKNFERVLRELENLGYWAALKKRDGRVVLFVFPAGKIPPPTIHGFPGFSSCLQYSRRSSPATTWRSTTSPPLTTTAFQALETRI